MDYYSGMQSKARILLVDDHAVTRSGLVQLIQDQGGWEVCGQAAGAGDALDLLTATKPDLMVIDLSLKDGHGLDLIKDVQARKDPPKILVISMHVEPTFAERALRAGALGYLPKSEAVDQIIEAIRRVLNGDLYLTPRMTTSLLRAKIGVGLGTAPEDVLSDRELQIFELLGEGLSSRKIGAHLSLSGKTIDSHRENIKVKLGLESGSELARRAILWVQNRPVDPPSE